MYIISKSFEFSASHALLHLRRDQWPPEDERQHQCSRDHGHNYVVELEYAADRTDDNAFVLDYGKLDEFAAVLKRRYDHRNLNAVMGGESRRVTAEALAAHFYELAYRLIARPGGVHLTACRVRETPKTCAEYRPVAYGFLHLSFAAQAVSA